MPTRATLVVGLSLVLISCSQDQSSTNQAQLELPACQNVKARRAAQDLQAPPANQLPKEQPEELCWWLYDVITAGGSLYAGTVTSVAVTEVNPRYYEGRFYSEAGTLRLRVDRTLIGPPQQELVLPFRWMQEREDQPGVLHADWVTIDTTWPAQPQLGERLLLLLRNPKLVSKTFDWPSDGPVAYRWQLAADYPMVTAFADVADYLAAKDGPARDALYRKLCQSNFRNLRYFALETAFRGDHKDSARQSQVILEYLKHAVPKFTDDAEWTSVTFWFGYSLIYGADWCTPELLDAFEGWYLTELAALKRPLRCRQALKDLSYLVHRHGAAKTLALFRQSGRAGLVERLEAVARSDQSDLAEQGRELLAKFDRYPDQGK
jgi:hypothetical protein